MCWGCAALFPSLGLHSLTLVQSGSKRNQIITFQVNYVVDFSANRSIPFTRLIKSRLWAMISHFPFIANDNGWSEVVEAKKQMADRLQRLLKVKMWFPSSLTVTSHLTSDYWYLMSEPGQHNAMLPNFKQGLNLKWKANPSVKD